jgi:hypothetical protein
MMPRRLAGLALVAAIAASAPALLGAAPASLGLAGPVCVNAAAQNHAAIVVEHADGTPLRTLCIGFDAAQVTGKQLLDASGIQYGLSSDPNYGNAVCQVDNEPKSYPPNCFSLPNYWSIWQAGYGQAWKYATKGVDGVTLRDGDAIGFHYVPQPSPAPPASPAGICPPPQPKPAPSSTTSPTSPPAAGPSAGGGTPSGRGASGAPALGGAAASPVPATVDAPTGGPTAPAPGVSATAHPSRTSGKAAASGPPVDGVLAAAAAGAALLAMLVLQVLVPRLRR